MGILKWLKWWFWETRRCNHVPSDWYMREFGMGKFRFCKKCGKCLELI